MQMFCIKNYFRNSVGSILNALVLLCVTPMQETGQPGGDNVSGGWLAYSWENLFPLSTCQVLHVHIVLPSVCSPSE